jgi:hypothetical protein
VAAPFFATAPSPCATAESHHLGSALGPGVAASSPDGCVVVSLAYGAGRNMTPSGISPVVAMRQSAMSSFRASATIIVLRVPLRPSVARARKHDLRPIHFGWQRQPVDDTMGMLVMEGLQPRGARP